MWEPVGIPTPASSLPSCCILLENSIPLEGNRVKGHEAKMSLDAAQIFSVYVWVCVCVWRVDEY